MEWIQSYLREEHNHSLRPRHYKMNTIIPRWNIFSKSISSWAVPHETITTSNLLTPVNKLLTRYTEQIRTGRLIWPGLIKQLRKRDGSNRSNPNQIVPYSYTMNQKIIAKTAKNVSWSDQSNDIIIHVLLNLIQESLEVWDRVAGTLNDISYTKSTQVNNISVNSIPSQIIC